MSVKQRYIIILLSFFGGSLVYGQQTWTLNQCVNYAIENNINLREYEISEQISLENVKQSKRNMLPGIGASTSASFNYGRSVDPNSNDYVNTEFFNNSYSLSSSIIVFNGFRLQNRIQFQKIRQQVSTYNRINATDALAFEVMTAFFDVVYYTGMLAIVMEQVEASELSLKTTEKKVEVGLQAKTDVLDMRANLEREKLNKIKIENAITTATLQLKQLMNYVSYNSMHLVDESLVVYSEEIGNPEIFFDHFIVWSPYYQSVKANIKASEKSLAISRSALYPSISASGSVNTGFYETNTNEAGETIAFRSQFENNRSQYVGASLSIPVFNRWNGRSNVKKAKLEIEQAKAHLEDERQKIFFSMINDLKNVEALYTEYKQYVKRSEVDALAFHAAKRKFDYGLIDINDYYISKNRLANTQSQVLRSRTQWEIKIKTLHFYKGLRFWETEEILPLEGISQTRNQ